jgi:hypothetical protein
MSAASRNLGGESSPSTALPNESLQSGFISSRLVELAAPATVRLGAADRITFGFGDELVNGLAIDRGDALTVSHRPLDRAHRLSPLFLVDGPSNGSPVVASVRARANARTSLIQKRMDRSEM